MSSNVSLDTLSQNDLRQQILDQEFMLGTMDVDTEDFGIAKQDVGTRLQEMKAELERRGNLEVAHQHQLPHNRVDDLFANFSPSQPTSVPLREHHRVRPQSSQSYPGGGFSEYAKHTENGFGGHFASDSHVLGDQRPTWSFTNNNASPSTPSHLRNTSNSSTTSISSYGQQPPKSTPPLPTSTAMSRKRQRESISSPFTDRGHGPKNFRATPSPAATGVVTPVSSDSFEGLEDNPEWYTSLMGGDPREHMQDIRREQAEAEMALRAKREQEKMDEEYARSLMAYDAEDSLPSTSSSSVAPPSSFHPGASQAQTILDTSGTFRRPDPPLNQFQRPIFLNDFATASQLATSSPYRNGYGVKQERPPIKAEQSTSAPRNFVDLGNDSDGVEQNGDSSSSDLVEIDPSSFHPNPRHSGLSYTESPSYRSSGYRDAPKREAWNDIDQVDLTEYPNWPPPTPSSKSYLDHTGAGRSSVYNHNPSGNSYVGATTWGQSIGKLGQNLSDAAQGAYGLIDSQINNLSGAISGFGDSGYGSGSPSMSYSSLGLPSNSSLYGHSQLLNVEKLLSENPFSPNAPGSSTAYQQYIDSINHLTTDPARTTDEIRNLLSNIRPDEDMDRSTIGSPSELAKNSTLYEHQKLGLKWMQNMEAGSNKGGILADDMGLGKTVQAIALMVTRRSADPARKTTLIIAPVALLKQWESEILLRIKPEYRLKTYIYHSTKGRNITWDGLRKYEVVLTTYGTVASEYTRMMNIERQKKMNPNWKPMAASDRLPLLGDECKWYRIILDEAQNIKNKTTKSAKAVFELQSLTRFCMSGTPMMNNVGELFSLIHFLQIKPYCEFDRFSGDFIRPLSKGTEHSKMAAMRKFQALLKAILLRRTKKSKIDGKPIITLPERTTEVQNAKFSEDEDAFYQALETRTRLQFNRFLKAGTVGKNYSNVLVLLLRLRQACCHPHLIRDFGVAMPSQGDMSSDELVAMAAGLAPDVVARIKEAGAIECPICMDSAENATIFTPCGHSTCSECFTRIADPTQATADDGGEGNGANFKCPNCRGKVDPKKITNWESFKKVHIDESGEEKPGDFDPQADIETASDSDSDDSSDDDDSSLDGFIVNDDVEDDTTEEGQNNSPDKKSIATPSKSTSKAKSKKSKKPKDRKGKGKSKPKTPRKSLAQLQTESRKNAKARRKYLARLRKDYEPSAKIEKTMELLQAIQDRNEGEKTIIFSQFTSLLDLLEIPIMDRDWAFRRYDGSMSSTHRNDAVIDFISKPNVRIMLVSLKAGNAGLNLTAASQVIILDPFWNPYIEEQAIDRAHRIGQRRTVQVHRILVKETVEDRILALQDKKRALIEGALDEGASARVGRLGERELAFLFGVSV